MTITLDRVSLTHPNGLRAVNGISCGIGRGERVAIIGPSGAGKTTLLRMIATALRPSDGTLSLLDVDPWRLDRAGLRRLRSRIGMVHQAPPIPPRQRVVTAVLAGKLGQWPLWKALASLVYPADIGGAQRMLERMEIADKLFERCDRLSGGQLQRVGVARVLYQQADLILTDEPVSAVDPALSDRIIGELNREAIARGVTLVASLHAVDLALHWFPRVIGIRNGEIVFDLSPVKISDAMLKDLYASESAVVPTQDSLPVAVPAAGIRRRPLCS
ncbi:MAG: phosphonate ABC transporter ATP-binding protein [Betaproteobacteria bacterium]|nr:phosphonate ABC transporter ATP-binding protein [Betaproteobacteria bacterium]